MGADRLAFAAASTRLLCGVVSFLVAFIAPAVTPSAEPLPRSVLFLDHNGPSEPFGQGMSAAFHKTISASQREHVAIYAETLDLIRSSGSGYQEVLKTYLREKYRDIPIGVIVATGTAAQVSADDGARSRQSGRRSGIFSATLGGIHGKTREGTTPAIGKMERTQGRCGH